MQNTEKQYYGHINLDVIENSHTQAFLFITEHCKLNKLSKAKILEIGCASGYFSEILRSHGMYVYGIEPFSTDALDNNHVDCFYNGPVESFCIEKYQEMQSRFDVIVLGDVVEHLNNPESVLRTLGSFLNNNGVFVVSVPNITHKGIQNMLKDGQWIYQKYGLLDSTHVRFFSWRSLRELFIKNGYGIDRRYDVCLPELNVYPQGASKNKLLLNGLKSAGRFFPNFVKKPIKLVISKIVSGINGHFRLPIESKRYDQNKVFQFVIRASRASLNNHAFSEDMPKNLLVVTHAPNSSLVDVRLKTPLGLYSEQFGGVVSVKKPENITKEDIGWAEVLIVHREISMPIINVISEAYKRGMSVVYDTDDNLFCLPEFSMCKLSDSAIMLMEYVVSIANRVTCPVHPLKKQLEKQSDNVYIVPNIISSNCSPFTVQKKQSSSRCTLVIASSDTIYVDFLVKALNIVCQKERNIVIAVVGNITSKFEQLPCEIKQFKLCSPAEFSSIISSFDNGVGLIPLNDSYFSSCKSPIKYFHYTSAGLVTIASNVQPYSDCINQTNGVLVENEPLLWSQAILNIVGDIPRRQQLLSEALKTWKSIGSDSVAVDAWKKVFSNLPRPYKK